MKTVMSWIVRHPFLAFMLIIALTLAFSTGIPNLTIDSSTDGLLVSDNPDLTYYREIKDIFGDDIILSVVIKSTDILQPEILDSVMDMTLAAEGMDGVTRVVSLATVNNLKGSEGMVQTDPLLPYVPDDPAELAEIRRNALENELFRGEVINENGTTTAVHLFLENRPEEGDFNGRITTEVENLMEKHRSRLGPEVEIYQCGPPVVKINIFKSLMKEGRTQTPLAILVLLFVLFLFFRTLSAVIIPCITGIVSVLMTLGFMSLMGFAVNPVTVIIPSLLIVVGSTEDIHLLAEYAMGLREGLNKSEAIRRMALRSGMAIFLTSLTTFIGFITIAPNSIPMLSEFGIAASFGIALNFVATISIVPHILALFPPPRRLKGKENRLFIWAERMLMKTVTSRKRLVAIAAVSFLGLCVWGCSRIIVDTDYISFFRKDSEIRRIYRDVTKNLVGTTTFMVIVDSGREGGIKSLEVLRDVDRLNRYMADRHDKVLGYTDFLRKMHKEMNDGHPDFDKIPDSKDLIAQYTLMMSQDDLSRFVDFDFSKTSIMVRSDLQGSYNLNIATRDIRAFINANLSRDLDYTLTGESILIAQASDTISRELLLNLSWVFLAIFVFISLLFFSFRAGLLAMIPNIVPILANFGVMGLAGIPLGTSTFPVAIIALGIAVDDTIHIMVRYSKKIKEHDTNIEAMRATLTEELRPIASTSIALMLGFSVLISAEFGSTVQFGILAAVTMAAALLSDLFLTPVLLLSTPLVTSWHFIRLKINRELSRTSPLFRGLTMGEIKRVAMMGAIREYETGAPILRQGEHGRDMYLLLQGQAKVQTADREEVLHVVKSGDVVGEMAFLTEEARTADVICDSPVEALEIHAGTLDKVRRRFPKVAAKVFYNLSRVLSARLKETTGSLIDKDDYR